MNVVDSNSNSDSKTSSSTDDLKNVTEYLKQLRNKPTSNDEDFSLKFLHGLELML